MHTPPFCPNRHCLFHTSPPSGRSWYVRNGSYRSTLFGPVQRFRCRQCGSGFSSQTFSLDFYVKRKVDYHTLLNHLITSSGIRDMARVLKVSRGTVTNRISRLARQAIAIHADLSAQLDLGEDLVADGFESFVLSQYFPNNIHILAGKASQFWIFSGYAHLRRKGRMTVCQKQRNSLLQDRFTVGRTTIYHSFGELIQSVLELQTHSRNKNIRLYTDEHFQYRRVMKSLPEEQRRRIRHVRISSRLPRTVGNELFSVNYLDREIRKDTAEHTRETVQFARSAGNSMERLAIYRLHHNYRKAYRENGAEFRTESHASVAGIDPQAVRRELKSLFTRRRFLSRISQIPLNEVRLWMRKVATPLKEKADYLPAYALE